MKTKPTSRKYRKYRDLAVFTLWALPIFVHAVTLIPLNSGMQMTCQFVNNTGGQYSNSQIYVVAIAQNAAGQYCHLDAAGNMVPCVAGENGSSYFLSLSAFPGFQFPPVMTSARLYVSLGAPLNIPINPGTPVGIAYPNISNPTDPSINTSFDWIEYNIGNGQIFCNTTQVDMFGISMLMDLYDNGAGGPSLNGEVGTTESTSSLMSQYLSAVPAAFAGLEGPIRIVAPLHGSFGNGSANAGYFDAYINSVWTQYASSNLVITLNTGTYTGRVGGDGRLAFTKPGDPTTYYVSKPTTNDVWGGAGNLATGNGTELALEAQICGAFHRHVIDNAANFNNVSAYYLSAPTDYYSWFWHQHNVNAKAYGFCYDDTNNQSSSLVSNNPRAIVLSIGGGAALTPTMTPTPVVASTWRVNAGASQYTDSQGNVWSADENYMGGTAAVTNSAIAGALPGAGDQTLYQSQRWGNPFTYVFNVPAGSYQVTLKFAETYWTSAGARVFNVSINGNAVLTNFDIFQTAGGANRAIDEVFNNIAPSGGAITITFGPASVDNAMVDAIQIIPEPSTPTVTPTKTNSPVPPSPTGTLTSTPVITQCDKRIVAYYAYWDKPNYTSANIPMNEITHIEHAFIRLDTTKNDGTLSVDSTFLEPALIARAHAAGVKVLVSVGGSDTAQGTAFEIVSASATARANFANNLYNFCKTNGYDGVDIDYEFPLNTTDESNLTLMMQAIRAVLPSPIWLLSMSTSAMGNNTWNGAYYMNLTALEGIADFFNVMDYDFYGGWDTNSGHLAPQYQNPADPLVAGSFKTSLDWYLITAGITPAKINAGMPFYADEFTSVNALWKNCGGGCPVVNQNYGSFVKPRLNAMGYTVQWDSSAQANYLTGADFITYESVATAANKTTYALGTRGVGGVMIWEISQDYDGATQDLLTSMYNAYTAQCPMNTPTSTFTGTATNTRTSTPTMTASPTVTNTMINTATDTSTVTFTFTATRTPTDTPTATLTKTDSMTPSPTNTGTSTASLTATPTATFSKTFTQTNTMTSVLTTTPTASPTYTATSTPTARNTGTNTFSPTRTNTSTATANSTATQTPTATSSPTGTSTSTLTKTATMTMSPTATQTPTATRTWTSTSTLTSTAVNTGTNTPTATTAFSFTNTLTFTRTPTSTPTQSSTTTPTTTSSPTATPTLSFTPTHTLSTTFTFTPTPEEAVGTPIPYPNPSTGPGPIHVRVVLRQGADWLVLKIFTLSFRVVNEEKFQNPQAGPNDFTLAMTDPWGRELANGLYYLSVTTPQGHSIGKWLILR